MASIITRNFIYMHPPKTGGTSFSSILMEQLPDANIAPGHTRFLHMRKRDDFANKLIVVTVRHPLDRIYALWNTRLTKLGFEEWIDALIHKKGFHWYATWPQSRWLPPEDTYFYPIRYENFRSNVQEALKFLGLEPAKRIPHKRRTVPKTTITWRQYFRTIPMHTEMLYEYYKKDFERLGYKVDEIFE